MYTGPAIIRTETRLVYPTDNFSYKGGGMSNQVMQPPLIRVRDSFREGQQGAAGWLTGLFLFAFTPPKWQKFSVGSKNNSTRAYFLGLGFVVNK